MSNKVALEPRQFPAYVDAIEGAGGEVVGMNSEVEALVWTDYSQPQELKQVIEKNPQLKWVQLPFAGVDAFADVIRHHPVFTSAKRSYSEPVAEHALMLCMALGRILKQRALAKSWGKKHADSLYDNRVLIVGGGGIAQELVRLLEPYRAEVVVVRKRPEEQFELFGNASVVGFDQLDAELPKAQFVVLACALTAETKFLFNMDRLSRMRPDAYLVNVARGEVIEQKDLAKALNQGLIAGAAIDVTYPEPLPDDHELWGVENLIITPHTADTMQIVTGLFAKRLSENLSAWLSGQELVGVVDKDLGY